MKNMYFQKLNKSPPGASESHTNSSILQAMSYIHVLIHENKTIDNMLLSINLGKARLLQDTLMDSDSDKAHVILEKKMQLEQYTTILTIRLSSGNYHQQH